MLKANIIGSKAFHLNPGQTSYDAAAVAAGSSSDSYLVGQMQPNAYTATVREDYDARTFISDATVDFIANNRFACGLFLTPENNKGNLLFQLSGEVIVTADAGASLNGGFIFGRKATNNTVAVGPNALASYSRVPYKSLMQFNDGVNFCMRYSVETELFTLQQAAGFVYCFAFDIVNNAGTDGTSGRFCATLSVRKFSTALDVFVPVG